MRNPSIRVGCVRYSSTVVMSFSRQSPRCSSLLGEEKRREGKGREGKGGRGRKEKKRKEKKRKEKERKEKGG